MTKGLERGGGERGEIDRREAVVIEERDEEVKEKRENGVEFTRIED